VVTREELLAVIEEARQSGQERLDLSGKQIADLPEEIGQLTNLTSLDLSFNHLMALPESIVQLTNLTSLNLRSNPLTVLSESIVQSTNLTSLDLSLNQLTALSESIVQLTNLTSLDLSLNKLTTLPESIVQLTNLTSLDLSSNQLTALPESTIQLTNLISLNLRSNPLTVLPESIIQLINLTSLDLSFNQLTALPESIGQLTHLTSLDPSFNQLTALPESIIQLTNLTSLDLSYNQLTELPESIGKLTNLTSLDLSYNQLTALPESIGKLVNLREFLIKRNSLSEILSEVVRNGGLAVRDYYRQRLEEQTDYIYEAKLLVIGEGGAGKTSLANKLINADYQLKVEGCDNPEKSTEGIDILLFDFSHLSGNPFRINIWDFGGQEIYHATHQFFLTKRSLYLLVADTRQENTDFNYWLEVIELLSESSPTLIIKNEKQDRPCQVNENQLRGRFPNLEKILPTNLATNRGLPEILTAIQHHISQLPHIGTPLPKTWIRVREALEADSKNYITQQEFLDLCDSHGFKRHADKLQLSGYLHDLGVCLHFQDDPVLKNWIILKPEWGTTAVYRVLDTKEVQKAFGYFTQADLNLIWADDQYNDMRDELLQLMMRFKLCYEIPHRPRTYIAPQLLSPNQPDYDWDDTDNLILRYQYDFMPKGMLTRFSVEMHRLIDQDLIWKDGVILIEKNARAEVIENYYRKEIRIRISGKIKKSLLEKIRHEFDKIHESYGDRLRYQEFIPCNCLTCKGAQTPFSYPLNRLLERLENRRDTIECDVSYEQVTIRNLLDDTIGQTNFPPNVRRDCYTKQTPTSTTIINNIHLNQEQKMSNDNRPIISGDYVPGTKNVVTGTQNIHTGSGDNVSGIKIVNSQNLAQAAQEIKALLHQLAQDNPTEGDFVIAGRTIEAIKNNPTLKQRILNAAKESGTTAVEKAIEAVIDNPAVSIVIAGVKGFIEADG
jgi:internalin A